jgi:hypothetical protein
LNHSRGVSGLAQYLHDEMPWPGGLGMGNPIMYRAVQNRVPLSMAFHFGNMPNVSCLPADTSPEAIRYSVVSGDSWVNSQISWRFPTNPGGAIVKCADSQSHDSRTAMASSASVRLTPASYRHTCIDIAGGDAYRQESDLYDPATRPSEILHEDADAQLAPALQDAVIVATRGVRFVKFRQGTGSYEL